MKYLIITIVLLLPAISFSQEWFCEQTPIDIKERTMTSCGKGKGTDEGEALRNAYEDAKKWMSTFCDSNPKCRGHEIINKPGKKNCKSIENGYTCSWLITGTISDKLIHKESADDLERKRDELQRRYEAAKEKENLQREIEEYERRIKDKDYTGDISKSSKHTIFIDYKIGTNSSWDFDAGFRGNTTKSFNFLAAVKLFQDQNTVANIDPTTTNPIYTDPNSVIKIGAIGAHIGLNYNFAIPEVLSIRGLRIIPSASIGVAYIYTGNDPWFSDDKTDHQGQEVNSDLTSEAALFTNLSIELDYPIAERVRLYLKGTASSFNADYIDNDIRIGPGIEFY